MLDDVMQKYAEYRRSNPNWRRGQSLFNALYDVHPSLANEIRGKRNLDPFYSDALFETALSWIIWRLS